MRRRRESHPHNWFCKPTLYYSVTTSMCGEHRKNLTSVNCFAGSHLNTRSYVHKISNKIEMYFLNPCITNYATIKVGFAPTYGGVFVNVNITAFREWWRIGESHPGLEKLLYPFYTFSLLFLQQTK